MRKKLLFSIVYVSTILAAVGGSFAYGLVINQIIANTVMIGIAGGVFLFAMQQEFILGAWEYDNASHIKRYVFVYIISLVVACALPLLPTSGWFYPVLALALSLYANSLVGVTASTLLLMLSVLLGGASVEVFALYFICNMTTIFIFRKLDDKFQVGVPVFISTLILLVATIAMDILFIPGKIKIEVFVIPIINLFITSLLMLILLKNFSSSVMHKYRNRYMTINDQEFELLVRLKKESKETYYHSIHCAYLCERIATSLGLDVSLAKALGYYHKIGVLNGKNSAQAVLEICEQNNFPPQVGEVASQYLDKTKPLFSKEGTILLFADTVITSIQYLFSNDKEAVLDYEQVIGLIIKKKWEGGNLNSSELSTAELNQMKKILIKEQLYYDFLR